MFSLTHAKRLRVDAAVQTLDRANSVPNLLVSKPAEGAMRRSGPLDDRGLVPPYGLLAIRDVQCIVTLSGRHLRASSPVFKSHSDPHDRQGPAPDGSRWILTLPRTTHREAADRQQSGRRP